MDKIFKEMSLCNKYYDDDFYARLENIKENIKKNNT